MYINALIRLKGGDAATINSSPTFAASRNKLWGLDFICRITELHVIGSIWSAFYAARAAVSISLVRCQV